MKQPIALHEEDLANLRRLLNEAAVRLNVARTEFMRWAASVTLAENQIVEAKRRGMTEFDPDRLLVPRARH